MRPRSYSKVRFADSLIRGQAYIALWPKCAEADAAIVQSTALTPAIPSRRLDGRPKFLSADSLADRYPWRGFALLSALYLIVAAGMSATKLLWLDELITLHIARLGSAGAIWGALNSGADPNPPGFHLLVMVFRDLFGEHAFVLRLPAVIGYWVGMLALFLFLKRRVPALWAIAGTLLSLAMGGFGWSYESRSYALFYGATMLALYCWTRHADEFVSTRTRYVALAGMTLSLAAGLCMNFFAVLAFFPIAAAEIIRTIQRVQDRGPFRFAMLALTIDWPVVFALAVAATPLLLFHNLIATSILHFAPYAWNKVGIGAVISGYTDMVAEVMWPLLALLGITFAVELLRKLPSGLPTGVPPWLANFITDPSPMRRARLLDYPEAAAVGTLIAYPFLGYALASFRGGMLSARFVIPVCFGAAIAGTLFAYRLFGSCRFGASIAVVLALLWFSSRQWYIAHLYEMQKHALFDLIQHIPPPDYPGQPVAFGDDLIVLPLEYYASPQLASRILYPVDFPAILRARGEASAETNFWDGRDNIYKFPIIPLAALQRTARTYLIVTGQRDWLVKDLIKHHYPVEPLPIETPGVVMDEAGTPLGHG
ncbi:MAG TPA: glycosyltransferase family 39 protein, partial [Acidobacteriaceae bacterium]|nr:glycosyltransferase family 39 protein [Acidobacteriaceae bacterium]